MKKINFRAFDLELLISQRWREKFKVVFDLQKNKKASQLFEKLIAVKEEYRNPLSHGYFFKGGRSLFVHMEHLGAIPMTMTRHDRSVRYGFKLFDPLTFKVSLGSLTRWSGILPEMPIQNSVLSSLTHLCQ